MTAPERKATCRPRFSPSLAAVGGAGRGLHADVAAEAGEEAAGQEGDRHERILHPAVGQNCKDDEEDEKDDADHLVLAAEIGHRPFAHVTGDLLHPLISFVGRDHLAVEHQRNQQSDDRRERRHPPEQRHSSEHGEALHVRRNGVFDDGYGFNHHVSGGGQSCKGEACQQQFFHLSSPVRVDNISEFDRSSGHNSRLKILREIDPRYGENGENSALFRFLNKNPNCNYNSFIFFNCKIVRMVIH